MRKWTRFAAGMLAVMLLTACSGQSQNQSQNQSTQQAAAEQPKTPEAPKPAEGTRRGITKDTVLVGAAVPLSGPVAYGGKGGLEGMNLWFDYINSQGGVHGRKIKIVAEDNGYDPGKTAAAVRKLVTVDQVMSIPAVFGTAPFQGVQQYLQEQKVPAWGWGPASAAYVNAGNYMYGIGTPYEVQAAVAMDFIATDLKAKEQKKKVAIVYPDDAYGEGILKGAEEAAKYHGIELHKERVPRQNAEFGTVALNLKRAGANIVIAVPPRAGTAALMKESQAQGLDVIFVTPSDANSETAIFGLAGDHYIDRFYAITSWSHWDDIGDKWVAWTRERLKAAGKEDVIKEKNLFVWFGLLHAMVTVEALNRAGPDLTVEKFVQALDSFESWDPGGISAPITYKGQDFRLTGRSAKASKAKKVGSEYAFETVTGFKKSPVEIKFK